MLNEHDLDADISCGSEKVSEAESDGGFIAGKYVDMLYLTFSVEPQEHGRLLVELSDLAKRKWYDGTQKPMVRIKHNDHACIKQVKRIAGEARRDKYQDGFRIKMAGSMGCIRLLFKTYSGRHGISTMNMISLRINPSAHGVVSMLNVRKALQHIMGNEIVTKLSSAKVTRLDLAVDVAGVEVDDFYFTHKLRRKYGCFTGQHGEIETLYLGERNNGMCIYNKQLEVRAKPFKADSYEDGEKGRRTRPKVALTRFEARMEPNISLDSMLKLTSIGEFSKLECYRAKDLVRLDPDFLDAAKLKGLKHVLKRKNPADVKIVKQVLAQGKVDLCITESGTIDFQEPMALLRLLDTDGAAVAKSLKTEYTLEQRRYVHEGLITQQLIKLARGKGVRWTKAQRIILGIKKANLPDDADLIGLPITKADALKLIAGKKQVSSKADAES